MRDIKLADFGQIVDFEENDQIKLPSFSITYLGEVDPEENSPMKSTSGIRYRFFEILDIDQRCEKIKIVHGQLPAAPFSFKIAADEFVMHTHQSSKGSPLFPNRFEIIKK